jgi:hypothetical protein
MPRQREGHRVPLRVGHGHAMKWFTLLQIYWCVFLTSLTMPGNRILSSLSLAILTVLVGWLVLEFSLTVYRESKKEKKR